MKIKLAILALVTAFAALFVTGCGPQPPGFLRWAYKSNVTEVRPATLTNQLVTVTNTAFVTNIVALPATTNADGIVIPGTLQRQITANNTVAQQLQTVTLPPIYATNWTLAPLVAGGIGAAQGAAESAGIPWAGQILGALTLTGSLLGNFWSRRNAKQAQAALAGEQAAHSNTKAALDTAGDAAKVLVANIEDIRQALIALPGGEKIDHSVMVGVQKIQSATGVDVKKLIEDLVEKHTDFTTPAAPLKA